MLELETWPSDANFILFRPSARDARRVWSDLLDDQVLVRDCSGWPGLSGCLRVTVGTPEENTRFLCALHESLGVTGSPRLSRRAERSRRTKETTVEVSVCLDGKGLVAANTGLPFFDHMLDQLGRHSGWDLNGVGHRATSMWMRTTPWRT